ncbi:MAG: hypothetical protein AMXMBFR64_39780 [Myxococcales bacterium]
MTRRHMLRGAVAVLCLTLAGCKAGPEADDLKLYATDKAQTIEGHVDRIGDIEGKIVGAFGMAASTSLSQVEGDYIPALEALSKAVAENAPATEKVKAIHARYAKAVELRLAAAKKLAEGLRSSQDAGRDIPDEIREAYGDAMKASDKELGLARVETKDLAKDLGVKLPE